MQCAACNGVYPTALDACPQCRKPNPTQTASPDPARPGAPRRTEANAPAMTDNSNATATTTQSQPNSTLIEFPGVNRNRPAWRKELSERFREIQQRRAREAALEGEEAQSQAVEQAEAEHARAATRAKSPEPAKQLGLVPTPDEQEMNPIVAAALRRIERARRESPPLARQGSGRGYAATAAARVVEEQTEQFAEQSPAHVKRNENSGAHAKRAAQRAERVDAEGTPARPSTLAVVPPKQSPKSESKSEPAFVEETSVAAEAKASAHAAALAEVEKQTSQSAETTTTRVAAQSHSQPVAAQSQTQSASRQPRHIAGVIDDFYLERQGLDPLPKVAKPEMNYDDRAPRVRRLAAAFVDLLAVAFLCAPFAAAIELTIGNWGNPRVFGSMGGIVAVVMFLYHTCSVALAGRTWGMALCSLRAVDSRTALVPTTGQCARRALVYILSLATAGLGILYSLFDAEGRTAHDILSGTVVVRQ